MGAGKARGVLEMKMTTKGQVTIPLELRARFGFGPGMEVEVVAHDDGALVYRPSAARLRGVDQHRPEP